MFKCVTGDFMADLESVLLTIHFLRATRHKLTSDLLILPYETISDPAIRASAAKLDLHLEIIESISPLSKSNVNCCLLM